jgi:hypothetical protein
MTRRDDKTWRPPIYRQLETNLAQHTAKVSDRESGASSDAPEDSSANDTLPEPLPPIQPDPTHNDTPVDPDADAEAAWRELFEAPRVDDADLTDTTDLDTERLFYGLTLAAQRRRVGPPVVTDVTHGHRAAIYSAPSSTVPPSPQSSRPVGDYAPRGVHFSRTEQLPLPVAPAAPPPSEQPAPPSSGSMPAADPDPARRAPTIRIRRSDPPPVTDYTTPPQARRGRLAVLLTFVGTVGVGCFVAFVMLRRETLAPSPPAPPVTSPAMPASAAQTPPSPAAPPPAVTVSPSSPAATPPQPASASPDATVSAPRPVVPVPPTARSVGHSDVQTSRRSRAQTPTPQHVTEGNP